MKRFFVVILSIVLFSCSNDDDGSSSNAQPTIKGEWNLVNVSGGFTGGSEDFEKGVIVWSFDESTNMVTITNDSTNSSVNTLLPSGTYTYNISSPADVEVLIVNDISLGEIQIETSAFILSETLADGFMFRFER